ncbi:hypothetical protein FZ983_16935 [Azospirillum sp. B21]|uniref:SPRY domain-containing protein n=1 Tax=Azospirillum sp. B21 TaxID=2607496 RepID=UPI0011EF026D|nr:SPRY domain-containing protein [Azospirillum sp. B21]KAA0579009.1 hypothetical protein FZ983_16935 [Azospirillum sp. B21]
MPLVKDRVKQTTTTTGTGSVALSGTVSGFQTFAQAFSSGSVVYYCIADGTNWEVGTGTYTAGSPGSLSRDTILASSNSGAAVSWGVGTKDVFVTLPAAAVGLVSFPAVTTKTASATIALSEVGKLIPCSGAITLTLPTAAAAGNGTPIVLKNVGTIVVAIGAAGSDTVDGAVGALLAVGQSVILISDGVSRWHSVGAPSGFSFAGGWSPTAKSTTAALTNSNLTVSFSTSNQWRGIRTANSIPSGRYYWEMLCVGGSGGDMCVGILDTNFGNFETQPNSPAFYRSSGEKQKDGSGLVGYGSSWTAGDRIGIGFDTAPGSIWFRKNGVWQASGDPATGANPAFTGIGGTLFPACGTFNSASFTACFRAADLVGSVPTGFSVLP